jgi:hypothetical protein
MQGMPHVAFKIEPIRRYLVGHKPAPNRPHHIFEHSSNGFLVTGYEDGSDWLVSPLGRLVYGRVIRERAHSGWALAADRRDHHCMHLYILDFPAKSFCPVTGLKLTRNFDIVDYDGERLVFICPPADEPESLARELVVIDIASAQVADRFVLKGLSHFFRTAIGRAPDGSLITHAFRLGEANESLHIQGVARIHPLTQQTTFEVFPDQGFETFTISPSGRYVLKASKIVPPLPALPSRLPATGAAGEANPLYERSIEVWAGNPLSHVRNLPLEWAKTGDPWKMPAIDVIVWQPDEAAFWWVTQFHAICVGLDGRSSPQIRLNTNRSTFSTFSALPGRIAELALERETTVDIYRLDGSACEDLSPVNAPAPTVMTPSAAEVKRQRNAQTALTKIVREKSDLRFSIKTTAERDVVDAVDAITTALDRGLGWYASEDNIIKVVVKIAGASYLEERFFALVETLGPAAAPALIRLLKKCRADPDFEGVWSGELEDGRQAFGAAAKALAGIDRTAWMELAEYEKCIDDYHECYFRNDVIPHFLKSHGWCEESFALALADIVQVRGNLGDNFTYAWRRSGLAAAAQGQYTPEAFAELMLGMRDRMLRSLTGTFATFAAKAAAAPPPAYGWCNYDRLFGQIKESMTPWEAQLFDVLKQRSRPRQAPD